MANLLTRVPKRAQPGVATARCTTSCMDRTIYQQLSPAEVHGQLDRVVEQLREAFAQVAELLADAAPDILAFTAFPVAHWQEAVVQQPAGTVPRQLYLPVGVNQFCRFTSLAWPRCWAALVR